MKRKLTIAGIFLGLAVAMVLVIVASQQPATEPPNRNGFTLATNGQLVVQPRDGYGVPTIIAHLPKTNAAAAPPK
ncbi:MAG TPA: hypothetical protein VNT99_09520 [Methylomirabilota bacterium]|nr:hypothetical protein [Methylomirabilota bacterium]